MAGTKITSNVIADDAITAAHVGDGVITTAHISSSATPTFTDLTLTGNLTVQGTTTTLDTATLNVEDKNITLNYASGDSSGSANGAGITIQDAVNSSTDATILWDASNDKFDFSHAISVDGHITLTDGDDIKSPDNFAIHDTGGSIDRFAFSTNSFYNVREGGYHKFTTRASGESSVETLRLQNNRVQINNNSSIDNNSQLHITGYSSGHAGITMQDVDVTNGKTFFKQTSGATEIQTQNGSSYGTFKITGWNGSAAATFMNVNSSGKVDIGGSGALYGKLTVTQTSGADDDEGGIGIVDSSNGRSMRLYCSSTKSFINSGNGGGQLLVLNEGAGQVSIGNDDAQSMHSNANKLVVGTGSGDQGMSIFAGTSTGRYAFARAVGNNTDAYDGGMAYDGSRNLTFHTNAGSERLRINGSGHMAFGTTTLPGGMSSSSYKQFKIGGAVLADSGHSSGHNVYLANNLYSGSGNDLKFMHNSAAALIQMTGGKIYFRTHDGGGASADATATVNQRMQIHNNGRVAIGDHSPEGPLDIKGGSYNSIILGSNRTDNANKLCGIASYMYTNNTVSIFQGSFANGVNSVYYGSADGAHRGLQNHYFYVNSNYNATSGHTLALQITSAAHVGIKSGKRFYLDYSSIGSGDTYIDEYSANEVGITTGGSRKLAVSGGNLYVSGSVNANHNFSDERLKENIVVIPNALEKVSSLRGITFTRKADGSVGTGLIAQELEKVLPEAVYEAKSIESLEDSEAVEYKGIRYETTVGLLVEAIKELEARIKTLEG